MMWRIAICVLLSNVAAPVFAQTAAPNYTAMWWNPLEPGWGLNVAHQGDVLFPMWFTFGGDGELHWYSVSGATRQGDGRYAGDVFRFSGTPFNEIGGGPAFSSSTRAGTAQLHFTGNGTLQFDYSVDGITQSKTLARFNFDAEPVCTFTGDSRAGATNYTDMWWNAGEAGWGLTLAHQGDTLFGLWYTYTAGGAAQWLSLQGTRQADGSFRGNLNRASQGLPFNQISGAAATAFPLPTVGDFTLRFSNGESGTFSYRVDGVQQSKSISRFVFGSPVSVCVAAATPQPGSPADGCFRKPRVGDARTYRRTTGSGGINIGNELLTERVTGQTLLDDEVVLIRETFNSGGRRLQRELLQTDASALNLLQVDAYHASSGALLSTIRYSPARPLPLNPPVGSAVRSSYSARRETFRPIAEVVTFSEQRRIQRLPDEAVSTASGRVASACKFDDFIRSAQEPGTPPQSGALPVFETQSITWTLQATGQLRSERTESQSIGSTANLSIVEDTSAFQGGP